LILCNGAEALAILNQIFLALVGIFAVLLNPIPGATEDRMPVVSTRWLAENLGSTRLIVLDIRPNSQYKKGHIPGSFSAPLGMWAIPDGGLMLELPPDRTLRTLVGQYGIHANSRVIVVGGTETDFARADATRVAWTLEVAGLKYVSVLNGGYNKWIRDGREISTASANPLPFDYDRNPDRSSLAVKSYVLSKIGVNTILDTRIPEDYFGLRSVHGHIKSAVNLPAPWAFSKDGMLRQEEDLNAMVEGVVGTDKSKEIIVYCEVGGYASTWWFILTRLLGYRNVKLYDGSMQEWLKDPQGPSSAFSWK